MLLPGISHSTARSGQPVSQTTYEQLKVYTVAPKLWLKADFLCYCTVSKKSWLHHVKLWRHIACVEIPDHPTLEV